MIQSKGKDTTIQTSTVSTMLADPCGTVSNTPDVQYGTLLSTHCTQPHSLSPPKAQLTVGGIMAGAAQKTVAMHCSCTINRAQQRPLPVGGAGLLDNNTVLSDDKVTHQVAMH